MYHFNRRVPRKKKRYAVLRFIFKFLVFVSILVAIWLYIRRPQIRINDSGAKLVPTAFEEPPEKHITETTFEMDLPGDWKELERRNAPLRVITWKGTDKESVARTLDIYVDTIPATLAVNRVLPVSGEEDRLAVSPASENCVLFSEDTAKLSPAEAAKLKVREVTWQGAKFLCDIPNSLRNVVGVGSTEGINRVSVSGAKQGKHSYFLVYTDSSAHPDEKPFPDILRSFRAR